MVGYTLEQCWENIATDRLTEDADFGEKNLLFRWNSFRYWRVCKQAKLSYLGHRKHFRIHWKIDAPKTRNCLLLIFVQRQHWAIFLCSQSRSLSGDSERTFVHKNWRGGYWQHLISTVQRYLPHSPRHTHYFASCFLRVLSAAELMSFDHLAAAIWHRWTIICNLTLISQRQLAF